MAQQPDFALAASHLHATADQLQLCSNLETVQLSQHVLDELRMMRTEMRSIRTEMGSIRTEISQLRQDMEQGFENTTQTMQTLYEISLGAFLKTY